MSRNLNRNVNSRGRVNTGSRNYNTVPQSDLELGPSTSNNRKQNGSNGIGSEPMPGPVIAPLPNLNENEYAFFEKVQRGDFGEVEKALESDEFQQMSINKINKEGYTVLHLAVKTQDVPMVQLLLSVPGIELYDTILHAIDERNVELTKILLAFDDKISADERRRDMEFSQSRQDDLGVAAPPPRIAPTVNFQFKTGITSSIRAHQTKTGTGSVTSISTMSGGSNRGGGSGATVPNSSIRKSYDEEDDSASEVNPPESRTVSGSFRSRQEYQKRFKKEKDRANDKIPFDSAFHQVITPLMLAAQVGMRDLIELFYMRNERLENATYQHNISCSCEICSKVKDDEEDMTKVYERIHLFNALSQPAYIIYLAEMEDIDPVNYALDKIVMLKNICNIESVLGERFKKHIVGLEDFIVKLQDCCRTSKETEIFMSVKDSENKERLPHHFPRLWYAVELNLQKFVTTVQSQDLVREMWQTEHWADWESYGIPMRLLNFTIRIIAFPVIALIIFLAQDTKLGKILSAPISRFMNYVGSYLFFIGVMVFQGQFRYQRCNEQWPYYEVDDDHCKQRGPPTIGTEWVLIIYVLSFFVSTLKRQSVSWYWKMKWSWVELTGHIVFLATFVCWLLSWIWVQNPDNEPFVYALERKMWPPDCAEIFADGFFVFACICALLNILRFQVVFQNIGPMQVASAKKGFAFLGTYAAFFIIMLGFAAGLMVIYVPYKGYVGVSYKGKPMKQDNSLASPWSTLFQLYYNMHNNDNAAPVSIVAWREDINDTSMEPVHHYYNEFTGKVLFTLFQTFSVVIMLEVLTGFLGAAHESVDTKAWQFRRTELYLIFVKDTMLPPPFTLIPTLKTLMNAGKWITLLGSKEDPQVGCNFRQCCFITESTKTKNWKEKYEQYGNLRLQIIQRYKYVAEEVEGEQKVSREDVLGLREELAEIKEMLKKVQQGSTASLQRDSSELLPPTPPPRETESVESITETEGSTEEGSARRSSGRNSGNYSPSITNQPTSSTSLAPSSPTSP